MKHYLPRRLIALALSGAMVLSMMCTAFATETGTTDTDPFDFSSESAVEAEEGSESDEAASEEEAVSDAAESEETGTESDEAASEEGEASDTAESEESSTEAEASTESDSETVTVSSASAAAAVSEEDTETTSEETVSAVAVASEDDTSSSVAAVSEEADTTVQITSSGVKNGLLYVNGSLYTGYYMTSDGTMYEVTNGVYTKYSGLTSGSSTYVSSSDKKLYQCSSLIYKDGKLYTGYYMTKGNVMYKVSSGVYSKYSGNLSKGTSYYKDGTGTLTLSVGLVYSSGKVYTGYYMTSDGTMYEVADGVYSKYSGLTSGSSTYISSTDQKSYKCSSRIYKKRQAIHRLLHDRKQRHVQGQQRCLQQIQRQPEQG